MNITFIAFGTRGDVQPAIALSHGLQANGHRVRLLASANFKTWIESHGLEAATAAIDVQAVMQSEGGHDWVENGNNSFRQLQVMWRLLQRDGPMMIQDAWEASQDAHAIISSFTSDPYAVSLAEALRIKHVSALLQPALVATRSGAATMSGPMPHRASRLNYWFGKLLIETMPWYLYGAMINRFRQTPLGLPPQTLANYRAGIARALTVLGYSAHLVPPPADWPSHVHTTGYWFLDEETRWQPSRELLHFLESGAPPVCIGFGSMAGRDIAGITRLIIEAVQRSGQRTVLLSGWAGMGDTPLPETIFRLDAAPHEWLFPRVAAVVHHGGAGTTAAGLRAGKPTVIVPHLGDQPFWGKRVELLGVGPRAIPRPKLTVDNLAEALRVAATDETMRRRAETLGEKIRSENGVARAVAVIEEFLRQTN